MLFWAMHIVSYCSFISMISNVDGISTSMWLYFMFKDCYSDLRYTQYSIIGRLSCFHRHNSANVRYFSTNLSRNIALDNVAQNYAYVLYLTLTVLICMTSFLTPIFMLLQYSFHHDGQNDDKIFEKKSRAKLY